MAGRKKTADKKGMGGGCGGCRKKSTERKKPGPKPGSKKSTVQKIIGHTMPPRAQKTIESKYSALQRQMDQFGEHVASFVYTTNTDAGVKAMKMTSEIIKGIKAFKSEIRAARESLKPVFAG